MLAEVQLPQRPRCRHPSLGDLGAVLPRFPEPNPAGATPDGTPGSPCWVTPYLEKRAGTKPATLIGCCYKPRRRFTGRSKRGAGKAALRAGRPQAAPAGTPAAREGRGAVGFVKPQRLLLSGCGLSSLLRLLPEQPQYLGVEGMLSEEIGI
ncbi:unnamed protein product [Coccothraustes coccothraustes]